MSVPESMRCNCNTAVSAIDTLLSSDKQRGEQRRRRRSTRPTLLQQRRLLRALLRSLLIRLLLRERSTKPAAALSLLAAGCSLQRPATGGERGRRVASTRLPPAVADGGCTRGDRSALQATPSLQQLCVLLTHAVPVSLLRAAVGCESTKPFAGDSSRGSAEARSRGELRSSLRRCLPTRADDERIQVVPPNVTGLVSQRSECRLCSCKSLRSCGVYEK